MTRQRWLVAGGVVVAALAIWFYVRSRGEHVSIDLVQQFPDAIKRPTNDSFQVIDATLNGEMHHAIFTMPAPQTRMTWHVTVPDNAWFRATLGLKQEAWTTQGDGVLFMVGVSDGKQFDKLFDILINPYGNPTDRHWYPISLDLSQYAGETVDVICNTYSGAPGHDDRRGDLALWGEPRIVVQ